MLEKRPSFHGNSFAGKVFLFMSMLLIISFSSILAQKDKDVNIILECVEYIGNDKYIANFGYDNPNKTDIVVPETSSTIIYNNGDSTRKALNTFKPGRQSYVFQSEFSGKDRVLWHVTLPNGIVKEVSANINSNHCRNSSNIYPYYPPPANGKSKDVVLSPELSSLYQYYTSTGTAVSNYIFQINGQNVLIELKAKSGQYDYMLITIVPKIAVSGTFTIVTRDPGNNLATLWFPIKDLAAFNSYGTWIEYARPVFPSLLNNTGLGYNHGDTAMLSDFARGGYSITGQGIKIGVVSDSYNSKGGAETDVSNGDLPGPGNIDGNLQPVEVLKDYPYTFAPPSDEGRAMLQILHDIAPGAGLAFRTGYISPGDMAAGITELADAGCNIIVDDITYITEPFFRDGLISRAVDGVVQRGVTYFTAAGNFGKKSYSSAFVPAKAQGPSGITGTFHDFGTGDVYQQISMPNGHYVIVLQWSDGASATNDFDIYLADSNGSTLFGFNRNNIGTEPIEILPFTVQGGGASTSIVINRASGTGSPLLKYIIFRGDISVEEYKTESSTIVGQANSAGAITVGAVKYDNTPVFGVDPPTIASFSSVGGTPVNGVVRQKPDITAPNGVNTTVPMSTYDLDNDGFSEFYGTSAAAPHAAAVAALIQEAKLIYDSPSPEKGVMPLSPAQMKDLLTGTSINMYDPGFDFISGFGFIQADKAIMTFASPKPLLTSLEVPSGAVPGKEKITVKVKGWYLTENTVIYLDNTTLTTKLVNSTEIDAEVPVFTGNPPVTAYTEPISSSQKDGGYSDPVYFFGIPKKIITIKANDASKKFGEQLPEFTSVITVNGGPVNWSDFSAGTIARLTDIIYTCSGNQSSDAGKYIIRPSLYPVVGSVTDPSDPFYNIDKALLEKYELVFADGELTVGKMGLKITPMNVVKTYGENLIASDIKFKYELEYDPTKINLTREEIDAITGKAEKEHHDALTDGVLLVDGVTIVDGIPIINGIPVVNGIPLMNGTANVNGTLITVTIENGIPVINGNRAEPGIPILNGIPIVNGYPIVNFTDIISGEVLVNGVTVYVDHGSVNRVGSESIPAGIPVINGIPIINGEAKVNGITVLVNQGVTYINGNRITSLNGTVNGIPVLNGLPIVNVINITNGTALYNAVEVPFVSGVPVVNGIPILNAKQVTNGVAIVNSSGTYEYVNLNNMSLLASENALHNSVAKINGLPIINGIPLVNGIDPNIPGQALITAANYQKPDGSVVDSQGNAIPGGIPLLNAGTIAITGGLPVINGMPIINGYPIVNGIPVLNGAPVVNGIPLVNSATINNSSNSGSMMVYDVNDFSQTNSNGMDFKPICFVTGNTVGYHWIVPGTYLSGNFEISYGPGLLNVEPAPLIVKLKDNSKVYRDADPSLGYEIVSPTELFNNDNLSGAPAREPGENVGNYQINRGTLSAGPSYRVLYQNGVFSITPAPLTVTAGIAVILEGDPLPVMSFTYAGFRNGDTPLSVFGASGPTYKLTPEYKGAAGTYTVTPIPSASNYKITAIDGTLYVNPSGTGAKAVRPILLCIDVLTTPFQGYNYIAHFKYENKNATDVYIPVGVNNTLFGKGSFTAKDQPVLFKSGGGLWDVPFDGLKISWQVTSIESGRKTSIASDASSTSSRCSNKNLTVAPMPVDQMSKDPEIGLAPVVYPNPAKDKVTIKSDAITENSGITISDLRGGTFAAIRLAQFDNYIELDISALPSGMYIVTIGNGEITKLARFIKSK